MHWSYSACPLAVLSGLKASCPNNIREVKVLVENDDAESDLALSVRPLFTLF